VYSDLFQDEHWAYCDPDTGESEEWWSYASPDEDSGSVITLIGSFGVGVDSGNPAPTLPAGISFGDAIGAVGICSTSQTLTAPAGCPI